MEVANTKCIVLRLSRKPRTVLFRTHFEFNDDNDASGKDNGIWTAA
jgi:hypothetical protein